MDKSALRLAIIARLESELAVQTAAAHASRSEATDADSKAEGKYDMRAQSAAYLAAWQAKFAAEISEAIAAYHAVALPDATAKAVVLGALVTLRSPGGALSLYFLGPLRGGLEVECDGAEVTVITPASPLGRQLVGLRAGDQVTLPGRKGQVVHSIAGVE